MTNVNAHPPGGESRKSPSGSHRARPAARPPRQIPFASLAADYVRFRCVCGRVLQAVEGMEGHEVRCPACHEVAEVPGAKHEEAIPELAPLPSKHESKIPTLAPMEEPVAEVEPLPVEDGDPPELKPMADGESPEETA